MPAARADCIGASAAVGVARVHQRPCEGVIAVDVGTHGQLVAREADRPLGVEPVIGEIEDEPPVVDGACLTGERRDRLDRRPVRGRGVGVTGTPAPLQEVGSTSQPVGRGNGGDRRVEARDRVVEPALGRIQPGEADERRRQVGPDLERRLERLAGAGRVAGRDPRVAERRVEERQGAALEALVERGVDRRGVRGNRAGRIAPDERQPPVPDERGAAAGVEPERLVRGPGTGEVAELERRVAHDADGDRVARVAGEDHACGVARLHEPVERDEGRGTRRHRGHVRGLGLERGIGRGEGPGVGGHVAGEARLGGIGVGELDGGHDVGRVRLEAGGPERDVGADAVELGGGIEGGGAGGAGARGEVVGLGHERLVQERLVQAQRIGGRQRRGQLGRDGEHDGEGDQEQRDEGRAAVGEGGHRRAPG